MTRGADREHPSEQSLLRFLRGDLEPAARREVVRHLLTRCADCTAVTRPLWALGDEPETSLLDAASFSTGHRPTRSRRRGRSWRHARPAR